MKPLILVLTLLLTACPDTPQAPEPLVVRRHCLDGYDCVTLLLQVYQDYLDDPRVERSIVDYCNELDLLVRPLGDIE